MIARIRRGNDFKHTWTITWNGQPEDFSDATDITLTAKVHGQVKTLTEGVDYHIDGNLVTIDFTPTICDITGTYTIELNYIKPSAEFVDGDRRSAVDVQAFQIVNTSAEANATEGVSLTSEALAIYALKYEDLSPENIAELQRPATEAAESIGELEQTIEGNEAIRQSNESDRQIAEGLRQTNTLTAIQNANTAADNANERSSHPPVIIDDYWHSWNFTTNQYETTGQYARGDSAIEGALVVQEKGQSAVNTMSQKAITDELEQLAGDTSVKIENLVANGNFSNGLLDWTIINATGEVEGGILTATCTNATATLLIRSKSQRFATHIYYGRVMVSVPQFIEGSAVVIGQSGVINHATPTNGFEVISGVYIGGSDNVSVLRWQGEGEVGDIVRIKYMIALDLTQIFGAGKEPTKEEMDLLISTLGIEYFEGEITVTAQNMMQFQLEMIRQNTAAWLQLAGDVIIEKYLKQSDTVTKYYDRSAGSSIQYPNDNGYAWAMAFVPDSNITINGSYLKPTKLLDEVHICLLEISPTNVITVLQEHDITKKWNDNIGQVAEFYFDEANLIAGTMYAIGQKNADLTTHIGFYQGAGGMPAGVSQKRPRISSTSGSWTFAIDATTVMYAVPSLFDILKVKTSLNADSSIEGKEIAENTIGGSKLKDNSVTESKLANLSVTAEKINFGAVTEEKTNFLIPTKNIFNKDAEDVALDVYVRWEYGDLQANSAYNATGFIPIVPGQTYTRSYQNQTAFYDLNKVYVSGLPVGSSPTFVAPENCYFVRCTVEKTAWETFQLEEGSESTGYVPYGYYLPEKYLPVVTPVKTFANDIVTPKKQYLLSNYENSIYFKALVRRWRPDYEFVRIEGGEWLNMKTLARITNPTVEPATVNARIYDLDFEQVASDTFAVQIGNIATDNGAIKGIYIGDSLTYNGAYIVKVNELLPNISWDGTRKSYGGEIYGEGRGGWRLSMYFERIHGSATDSFTPFMHPVDPYKYYGNTAFWAAVVNGGSEYGNNGFIAKATEIGFDAITGLLTTPVLNDCMWNDANGIYERWDGSAWVEIEEATLNFSFNFAKYRSTWLIDQPDVVTVMLGTNDFRTQASESAIDGFWTTWKTWMDTLCASVISDSPSAKIAILLPPTDCGSLDNSNGDFTVKQTAMMWYGRKKIINDFDDREIEGIYLVDVGRSVDPDYGFAEIYQTPFSDYNGTEKRYVQSNTPHPGADGYEQLGIPLAGWIQKVR